MLTVTTDTAIALHEEHPGAAMPRRLLIHMTLGAAAALHADLGKLLIYPRSIATDCPINDSNRGQLQEEHITNWYNTSSANQLEWEQLVGEGRSVGAYFQDYANRPYLYEGICDDLGISAIPALRDVGEDDETDEDD